MKRLWNPCGRCRERLSLLASGALAEEERSDVEGHLADCAGCRKWHEEAKRVTAPLADWERIFAHIEPSQPARRRWAQAIKAAGEPRAASSLAEGGAVRLLWQELIRPCRGAWTGLAACWLAMLCIHFGLGSDHRPAGLEARLKPTPGMRQAWEEQRRLLAELMPTSQPAEPPRRNNAKPRSQRPEPWQAC